MNRSIAGLVAWAALAAAAAAQESATPEAALPKLPSGRLAFADADCDGLPDAVDPEPFLSNLSERFVFRLESPTLTWELDQEQFTQIEKSSETIESQLESARQAAQDVLSETTGENRLTVDERVQPEPGWLQLSINPLAILGGLFGGVGALDALASGLRVDGGDARSTETTQSERSLRSRVEREESRSREVLAERRTRLLQIQRYTRVLRNPKLQLSLHVRNGGDSPLVLTRPEVPVLAGARILGVARPIDERDRDRVVIPAGRTQAILLAVPVDDTEFWDALTKSAESISYEPLLGAMRAHFEVDPDRDLLALQRDARDACVPGRMLLPEGVTMERPIARATPDGKPVTARQALAAWNGSFRRQNPGVDTDLIRTDAKGQVIAAAGRTGSALGSGWQLVVDGAPLPIDAAADVPVLRSLELRWTDLRPEFGELADRVGALDEAKAQSLGGWVAGGVAAVQDYRSLRRGVPPEAVAGAIEARLAGPLGNLLPRESRGATLTMLGEARRLVGDIGGARANWEKAASCGDPQAILSLANQLLELPDTVAQGVDRVRQAAAAGSAEALVRLADIEQQAGDNRRAMLLVGQAADAGYAPALTALAQRYEVGDGLPRDTQLAVSLYRRAAAKGDSAAMLRLGILYETGVGLPRDAARANAWYRAAAAGKVWTEDLR
ncbi:MAG: hypothetical protein RL398_3521 [Planctomycetota bacterium]